MAANTKLSIRCSEDTRKAVKQAALDCGETVEQVVLKALAHWLKKLGYLAGRDGLT